jgi:hypothetical protein
MLNPSLMVCGWMAVGAFISGGTASAQGLAAPMDLERRLVVTPADAYLAMPAEVICEPMVEQMKFSDSGRYLLMTRQSVRLSGEAISQVLSGGRPPAVEHSIVLWDSKTGESRTMWKTTGDAINIRSLAWIPGSDVALGLTFESTVPAPPRAGSPNRSQPPVTRQSLLRIVAGSDRAQILAATPDIDRESYWLQVSPNSPMALLRRDIRSAEPGAPSLQQALTIIGSDGRLGKSFPAPAEISLIDSMWSDNGNPVLFGMAKKVAGQGPRDRRLVMDPKSGAFAPYDKEPTPPVLRSPLVESAKRGLRLKMAQATVKESETVLPVGTLWVESIEKSPKGRILLSGDSSTGQFTPAGDAVLFQSQGALMAVRLVRVDKQALAAAREAAQRAVTISNAKQLGLAAHMYAQDHNESLPTGDDINAKLGEYVKNGSIFDGFNYTFSGGPIKDIDSPAETELGFVSSQGGRAVIYVDGHVKWRPDR